MLDHFLTTDDYTCLLHEATPIIYALVHKAYIYAVQMHIPSSCNNLCSQGCSSLSIKVGSEVNDYRLNQLCMWTYYMHMFSLSLCSFLGLQCALVSRETLTWLTCNCVNFLYQPATPVTTQGLKRSFCFSYAVYYFVMRTSHYSTLVAPFTPVPVLSWRFAVTLLAYWLPSTCIEKTASPSTSQPISFSWNTMDVFAVHVGCCQGESLQHLYDTQYSTSSGHSGALVFTGSHCSWSMGLSMKTSVNVVLQTCGGVPVGECHF